MRFTALLPLGLAAATSASSHTSFHLQAVPTDPSSNYTNSLLSLNSARNLVFPSPGSPESASVLTWSFDPKSQALLTTLPSSSGGTPYRLALNDDEHNANGIQPGNIYTWVGLHPGTAAGARFKVESAAQSRGKVVFEDGTGATFAICPGGALFRRPGTLAPHFSCKDAEIRAIAVNE